MTHGLGFPTILVAENDSRLRQEMVSHLRLQGYLVLEAGDGTEALKIARIHSRPIQLMVTGETIDGRTLAALLKQYRPDMRVLFIAHNSDKGELELLAPDLARVQEILKPPAEPAAGHNRVSRSSAG